MKTVMTIIGARPQFIKAAAVSRLLLEAPTLNECIVHTGQHYDPNMSAIFFDELKIPEPSILLNLGGGSHGAMTGRMLEQIEAVAQEVRPDIMLVYGDTNSTLAGALAAAKLQIPVAHVEAGLRSFNRAMPEEINRIFADQCSDVLYTPTNAATSNLRREGVDDERIVQVGDVMFDVALLFSELAARRHGDNLPQGMRTGEYVLASVHRQENTDHRERLAAILGGLQEVASETAVVLPLHPRTRRRIETAGLGSLVDGLTIVEPLGYLDIVALERHAAAIATDSGGMQKEAFFHRVPCVTLRDETEWVELVDTGWNRLVQPTSATAVADGIRAALGTTGVEAAPYGNGDAAPRITRHLREFLC